jgi:hypothetical protein
LKITQLIKFDQTLSEVYLIFIVNAQRYDVLSVNGKAVRHLFIAFHGCTHLFDHTLSEMTFSILGYCHIGMLLYFSLLEHKAAIDKLWPINLKIDL